MPYEISKFQFAIRFFNKILANFQLFYTYSKASTYQDTFSRKHDYLNSPSGERANNAFFVGGKKDFANWNHRERHIRFALTPPHKHRMVYQEGDIFLLRDWKTKDIISRFPAAEEFDDVSAAPIKPTPNILVTRWGKIKSRH